MRVIPENALAVKSNTLIEANYRLTLREMRVIYWLFTRIRRDDQHLSKHKISFGELSVLLGIENTNKGRFTEINNLLDTLASRQFRYVDAENGDLVSGSLIPATRRNPQNDYVELRLADDLIPFVLNLDASFTQIKARYAMQLTSFYAMRMYELFTEKFNIGMSSFEIDIEKLRFVVGADYEVPVTEEGTNRTVKKLVSKLTRYNDFKQHVLEISKREINEKTDLSFDYEERRRGRKVYAIAFEVKRGKKVAALSEADTVLNSILARLEDVKIGVDEATALIADYGKERVAEALANLEMELIAVNRKERARIKKPANYLRGILKNGSSKKDLQSLEKAPGNIQLQIEEMADQVRRQFKLTQRKHALEWYRAQPEERQKALVEACFKSPMACHAHSARASLEAKPDDENSIGYNTLLAWITVTKPEATEEMGICSLEEFAADQNVQPEVIEALKEAA